MPSFPRRAEVDGTGRGVLGLEFVRSFLCPPSVIPIWHESAIYTSKNEKYSQLPPFAEGILRGGLSPLNGSGASPGGGHAGPAVSREK